MGKQQRLFTLHGSSRNHAHTWGTYLHKDGLEVHDVSAGDLDHPSLHDPRLLFHAAHTFATKKGFVGGYPTFHTSGNDYNSKHRIVLLSDKVAEELPVPEPKLNGGEKGDLCNFFGQFHTVAREMEPSRTTGYPTCHKSEEGETVNHFGVFIRPQIGVHTRVFVKELGNPMVGDVPGYIRAGQELAEKKGFAFCMLNGWHSWPESEVIHNFFHDMGVRHMVEHEGWYVQQVVPFAPTVDGEGIVHYVATFILTKD